MITLVDTSVWIDHFKKPVPKLIELLTDQQVITHSMVVGELACGQIKNRTTILGNLKMLAKAPEAQPHEILELIENRKLHGKGLGWADISILASALLASADLFTHDKRLKTVFQSFKR